MAQASSVYEKVKVMYRRIAPAVAMANPAVPPAASPRFHPKYIPEITYPTPRPHNIQGPKVRDNAVFSLMPKYSKRGQVFLKKLTLAALTRGPEHESSSIVPKQLGRVQGHILRHIGRIEIDLRLWIQQPSRDRITSDTRQHRAPRPTP